MINKIISACLIVFAVLRPEISCEDGKVGNKMATLDQNPMTQNMSKEVMDIDVEAAMMECNKTFIIEMSDIEAMNDSGSFPDENDRTPKCFLRCLLQQTRVASPDESSYDPQRAALVFSKQRPGRTLEDLEESAGQCLHREEKCKCERAYNFMKCLIEQDIEKHEITLTDEKV